MADSSLNYHPMPTTLSSEDKKKYPNNEPTGRARPVQPMDSRSGGRILGVSWQVWDESIGKRQQDINEELYDLAYAGL